MRRRICWSIVLSCVVSTAAASAQERDCLRLSPAQVSFIHQGQALHDSGDYAGALKLYAEVLRANPASANALFESAHTCEAMGDYAGGLEFARRGLVCESPFRARLYEKMAACHAGMRQFDSALRAIDAGLAIDSMLAPLYFLVGQIGIDIQRATPAASALQRAVRLEPTNERYHSLLGLAYSRSGRRLPAILAMSEALALNPASGRAVDMIRMIDALWIAGLVRAADGSFTVSPEAFKGIRSTTTEDGNFILAELTICSTAAEDLKDSATVNSMEKVIRRYEAIADLVGPLVPRDTADHGFAREFYPNFFVELKARGFIEPFVYYTRQTSGDPNVAVWLKAHEEELSKFLVWWREYQWPATR